MNGSRVNNEMAEFYTESHSGWRAEKNLVTGWSIIDSNGWPLAFLNYDYRYTCNATNHGRAHLLAAAPDMIAALQNVNKLVSEAAMTGFNCMDGDWAERLFASQQVTHAAIAKAAGEANLGDERQ